MKWHEVLGLLGAALLAAMWNGESKAHCRAECIWARSDCNALQASNLNSAKYLLAHEARSPLESPWAVIEVDERSEFSTEARGVLAASSPEYGQEAWTGYWRRQYLFEKEGGTNPSKLVRTVFIVDPVAYEPIEPRLWLIDSDIRPDLPRRSHFYFRGATRGDGLVAFVEPLYTTAPGYEADFIRFVKDQFRVESLSASGIPVLFYGSAYIDSVGNVIRGALNTTFISESDFERFGKLAF